MKITNIVSIKGSSLEEAQDLVFNDIVGEAHDLDVLQDIIVSIQEVVSSPSNFQLGQDVKRKHNGSSFFPL